MSRGLPIRLHRIPKLTASAADVDGKLTVDAFVMATAALLDAVVVTGDPGDFDRLGALPGCRRALGLAAKA